MAASPFQEHPRILAASPFQHPEPWDAVELDVWGNGPRSYGERVTAQFLLKVWDPSTDWKCGRFDLTEALRIWDAEHH